MGDDPVSQPAQDASTVIARRTDLANKVSGSVSVAVSSLSSAMSLTNHPKASAAAYAAVATPLIIAVAKHYGLDLSGQEANVTSVVMLVAALIAPND